MNRKVPLLHRTEDPETSADPRVRSLVSRLSQLEYAPAPRPQFRAELRSELVAITGRVVLEGEPAAATATTRTPEPAAARRRRSIARPLGLAAACCAVLALGLGGAVWKSRSALPGDSLYGLKRASESVQLSLASGDSDRGREYLQLASTRVREARDLLGHTSAMAGGGGLQADGISPSTVALVRSTLRSADGDVRSGSSLLGTEAVQSHSANPLTIMTSWAPAQLSQLSQLAATVSTGPAHTSALRAWTLVHSALQRARTLEPQVASNCTAARTDPLGPVSCTSSSHPSHEPATRSTSPNAARTHSTPATSPAATSRSAGSSTPSTPAGHGTHSAQQHPASSGTSPGADPTLPALPTLPITVPSTPPSVPVSINSCGISVGVGPVGIRIGGCPTHS